MYLVSEVVFNYSISPAQMNSALSCQFSSLKELREAVQNTKSALPFMAYVQRVVKIKNTQDPIQRTGFPSLKDFAYSGDKYKTVQFDEHFSFIVADKLLYPSDVRELLKKQFGNDVDLGDKGLVENIPVFYSGTTKRSLPGLIINGRKTTQEFYSVSCRNLKPTDIVVDRNLHQIWPTKTNQMPPALTDMLARTKEVVH